MTGKEHFGFIAVVGLPNAGKSTLINQLCGVKVSIVSPKAQTTRLCVTGILNTKDCQAVYVDTPGLFAPSARNPLEKTIVQAAWSAFEECDTALFIHDATKGVSSQTRELLGRLAQNSKTKMALVLNKTDRANKEGLLALSAEMNAVYPFEQTFMVSALKGKGTEKIADYSCAALPEGPPHFDEEEISTLPHRIFAAEITREKLFHSLHQELPYQLSVTTDAWEDFENGDIKLHQTITVTRDNHKGIILGKGGQNLKKIGMVARQELEKVFATRVHLKLFVKVDEKWMDAPDAILAGSFGLSS